MLGFLLEHCPNLKYVPLEQLGPALQTEGQRAGFADDFQRMRAIVEKAEPTVNPAPKTFSAPASAPTETPLVHPQLAAEQRLLTNLLETSADVPALQRALAKSTLADSDWRVAEWGGHMLDTVFRIAQKWA